MAVERRNLLSLITSYLVFATAAMVIIHQFLWSPIHGDGAVYAQLLKEASQTFGFPLHWREGVPFFEHPYLYFYTGGAVLKAIGVSDLTVKIPNYLIAAFIVMLVYRIARTGSKSGAGLIAVIALVASGIEHQTRQPSLDPMAHLLSLASLACIYFARPYWLAGMFLGLAFVTKGLELLPALGAIGIYMFLTHFEVGAKQKTGKVGTEKSNPVKNGQGESLGQRAPIVDLTVHLLQFSLGFLLPIGAWLALDASHGSPWLQGYVTNQFRNRFFQSQNFSHVVSFEFPRRLLSNYAVGLAIMAFATVQHWRAHQRARQRLPALWIFVWSYIALTTLAFMLIKKDSLQHFTGIFVFGSIVVGQGMWSWFESLRNPWRLRLARAGYVVLGFLFVGMTMVTIYYFRTPFNKDDLWGNILRERVFFRENASVPVAIDPNVGDFSGLFFTSRWHWPNKIVPMEEVGGLGAKEYFVVRPGRDADHFEVERIRVESGIEKIE